MKVQKKKHSNVMQVCKRHSEGSGSQPLLHIIIWELYEASVSGHTPDQLH